MLLEFLEIFLIGFLVTFFTLLQNLFPILVLLIGIFIVYIYFKIKPLYVEWVIDILLDYVKEYTEPLLVFFEIFFFIFFLILIFFF